MAQQVIGDLVYQLKVDKGKVIADLQLVSDSVAKLAKGIDSMANAVRNSTNTMKSSFTNMGKVADQLDKKFSKVGTSVQTMNKSVASGGQKTIGIWDKIGQSLGLISKTTGSLSPLGGAFGKLSAQASGMAGAFSTAQGGLLGIIKAGGGILGIATGIGVVIGAVIALKTAFDLAVKGLQLLINLSYQFVRGAINAYSSLQTAQIAYNALVGDNIGLTNQLIDDIQRLAMISPSFTLAEGLDVGKRMMAMGTPPEELVNTMRMLGDVAAATGAPLDRIALVFGQIRAAGKIMGNDWMQLKDAGIPIFELIGDSIGKTAAEVMKMKEEGESIDFETVNKAFEQATSEGGKFDGMMEKLGLQTIPGTIALIKDFGTIFLQAFGTPIGEAVLSVLQPIAKALVDLADVIVANKDAIADALGFMFEPIENIGKVFGENIGEAISHIGDFTDEILDVVEVVWDGFSEIFDTLGEFGEIFADAFDNVGQEASKVDAINDPLGTLKNTIETVNRALEGMEPSVTIAADSMSRLSGMAFQVTSILEPYTPLIEGIIYVNNIWTQGLLLVNDVIIIIWQAIIDFIDVLITLYGQFANGPGWARFLAGAFNLLSGPIGIFINLVHQAIAALEALGIAQSKVAGGAELGRKAGVPELKPKELGVPLVPISTGGGGGDTGGGGGGGGKSEAEKNAEALEKLTEKRADAIEKFNETVRKSFEKLNETIADSTDKFADWYQETFGAEQLTDLERAEQAYSDINKNIHLFGFLTETYTKSLDNFNSSLSDAEEEEKRLEQATKDINVILDTAENKVELVKEAFKDFEDAIKDIEDEYENIIEAQDDYNKKLEEIALEKRSPLTRAQVMIGNFLEAINNSALGIEDLYDVWEESFDGMSDSLEQLTEDHDDMFGEIDSGVKTVIESYEEAKEALEDWQGVTEDLVGDAIDIIMDAHDEIDDLMKDLFSTDDFEKQQEILAKIREQESIVNSGEQFQSVSGFSEGMARAEEWAKLNPIDRLIAEFEFENQIRLDQIAEEEKQRQDTLDGLQKQIDEGHQKYLDDKKWIEQLQIDITTIMLTELNTRENATRASLDRIKAMFDTVAAAAKRAFGGGTSGFALGGPTGDGNPNDVAGVVHKGEYVIPNHMVKSNTALINALERQRLGGGQTYNQTVNNYNTISDGADAILLSNRVAWRLKS